MRKVIIAILLVSLIGVVYIMFSGNSYDKTYVSTLPKTYLLVNNKEMGLNVGSYNFDSKKGSRDHLEENEAILEAMPNDNIKIVFDVEPHEYNLSLQSGDIETNVLYKDNVFKTPNEKGIYKYNILARWYDKGTVSYCFVIEVK